MSENAITVNVDEYLAANKYEVDEGNPHITLADDLDDAEFDKLVKVCPAALYKRDEDGARLLRLRRLPGMRHLSRPVRGHRREQVEVPRGDDGRGVSIRLGRGTTSGTHVKGPGNSSANSRGPFLSGQLIW